MRFKRPPVTSPVAAEPPAPVRGPRALLGLQRAAGNRAVSAFLAAAAAPERRPAQLDPGPIAVRASAPPGSSKPTVTGRPVTVQPVTIQRTLTNGANWSTVDPTTGQGTNVVAVVGPGYTYGSGPSAQAGFRPYDYTALFSAATVGAAYCQGHLLNDNLGGPGNPNNPNSVKNLTAFPQQPTNGDHKNLIEKQMKTAATSDWFQYTVSIGYSADSAPRLFHRLGTVNRGWATAAGLKTTDATFGYASSLTAHWTELDQGPAASNTAPPVKAGGVSGSLSLAIPSPLSFVAPAKQLDEYPGGKGATWSHLPTFKKSQTSGRAGTLPPTTAKTSPPPITRVHVMPQRWLGIDAARTGAPIGTTTNPAFRAGHAHYLNGVAQSKVGKADAGRFGHGYNLGYEDYGSGIEHGRKNPLGAPPASPQAAIDGHTMFWTGVAKGKIQLLSAPPVGSRAETAGHADFWEGVKHGRTNPKATVPVNLAQAEGHNDYWAGVEHAYKNDVSAPPVGSHAQLTGHQDYWAGVKLARADLTSATPPELGKAKGHTEVVDALKHARASVRGTALADETVAQKAVLAEYWQGVDSARANPGIGYAGGNAAEAQGVTDYGAGVHHAASQAPGAAPVHSGEAEGAADYWAGEAVAPTQNPAPTALTAAGHAAHTAFWSGALQARANLANFTGPAPAGRLSVLGFAAYRSGAMDGNDQQSNNAAQLAYALGWADGVAGYNDKRAGIAAGQPHGGYLCSYQLTAASAQKRKGDATTNPRAGKSSRHGGQ